MKLKETANDATLARKREVIKVAARLFAAKGYHATTLDEIAEEIGVTKPALYYYIDNKQDILQNIIGMMKERLENTTAAGRSDLPPKERLENLIRLMVKYAAEDKELTLIGFEQANILPKRSRNALKRRNKEVEQVVEEILKEGKEKGIFDVRDVKMTTFAILAVANWLYRWYEPKGGLTPEEIADRFINLLENGYLKSS